MRNAYLFAGGVCLGGLAVAFYNGAVLENIMPAPAQLTASGPMNGGVLQAIDSASAQAEQPQEAKNRATTAFIPPQASSPAYLSPPPASPPPAPEKRESVDQKPAPTVTAGGFSEFQAGVAGGEVQKDTMAILKSARNPVFASGMENQAGGVLAAEPMAKTATARGAVYDMDIAPYPQGGDRFPDSSGNSLHDTARDPLSTFSIDVDTASYAFVRNALFNRHILPRDAVRIEEMINYFPYEYDAPKDKSVPFKASAAVLPTPWNKETKLLHIGIQGYRLENQEKPRSNLVFLLDTSGSMAAPNRLPLAQNALKLLLENLSPSDTVGIVTYAGSAGIVLEPTRVKEKKKILAALDSLHASGGTAGAEGIRQAYELVERNYDKSAVNRVILATDGDFNVGITDPAELKNFVEQEREKGVFLSVLGFGMGNYNDTMMQTLAQNGNGNAAYIDTLGEARKVLVQEAGSTLFPIAKDVKIQVEFNPAQVSQYRLIGYETRLLAKEDFNNDKIDAGEIGAGHAVTALYEITPAKSAGGTVDALRYRASPPSAAGKQGGEYAYVKIRYKLPDGEKSLLISSPVNEGNEFASLDKASAETRFAVAVAAFGQLLRGDAGMQSFGYGDVLSLAESARGKDESGYRAEFLSLVRLAQSGVTPVQYR